MIQEVKKKKMRPETQERILSIASPIAILIFWQILSWISIYTPYVILDRRFIPSPITIMEAAYKLVSSRELEQHVGISLYRLSLGFLIGAVPGVIIGMIMGLSRWVRAVIDPVVAATYPIPKIAILPILMLFLGIGDASKLAVIAIAVIFLVLINTMVGVLTLDPIYFDVAKNYGANWSKLFRRVILPGALPLIFAGLRLGLGVSLIVIVAAEFVAAKSGIGYLIWTSWETLIVENMFVGIIVITVLGIVTTRLLHEVEMLIIPWKRERQ